MALAPSNVNRRRFVEAIKTEFNLKNADQIKNKIDSLFKKYKTVKKEGKSGTNAKAQWVHYEACKALFEERAKICDHYVRTSQTMPKLAANGTAQMNATFLRLNKLDKHLEEFKTEKEIQKEKQIPNSNLPFKKGKGKILKPVDLSSASTAGSDKAKTTSTIYNLVEESKEMIVKSVAENNRFNDLFEKVANKILE